MLPKNIKTTLLYINLSISELCCHISWGNTYKTMQIKLTKIPSTKQKKCIRCIFFADNKENANIYKNKLGILNWKKLLNYCNSNSCV